MNKKRLLSLLTAVTITASAFTGLVIPASAEGETSDTKVEWTFTTVPDGTKLTNTSGTEKEWYIADQALGNGLTAHSAGTLDETKQEYGNAFEVDRKGKTTFTAGEASEEVVGSLKFGGKSSATGRYLTYTPQSAGTLKAYVKHGSPTKANTDIRKLIITQGEAAPVEIATIGTDAPNVVGTADVVANQEVKITCDNNVALAKLVFTPSEDTPVVTVAPATDTPSVDYTALIDFTNRTLTATEKGSSTVFEVLNAEEAGATALAKAGADNVLKLGSSQNGASKNLGYTAPLAVDADGNCVEYSGTVIMSFKIEPMQVRNDKAANVIIQFADITKTPILSIDVGVGNNNTMSINGKSITTEFGKYYIVDATFDCDNGTATVIVKDAEGKELNKQENVKITASNLAYLYFANKDWLYGYCAIDDIQLDATQIGAPVYYTATFNTERYAKLTTSEKDVYYADVNGKLEIPLLKPGTTFNYTISKEGYTSVTGVVSDIQADVTEDKPLTKTDDSVLFIESEFGNASEAYVSPEGSRYDSVSIGAFDLPETFQLTAKLTYVSAADGQKTWALVTDEGRIAGLQITSEGMTAWTKWTGSKDMNQSTDIGLFKESVKLGTAPEVGKEFEVTFVVNTTEKTITVLYGDTMGTMAYDINATKLTGMDCGLYRTKGELRTNEIKIITPDPKFIVISGDSGLAKISGETVTRTYKKVETVIDPEEVFNWTVSRKDGKAVTGLSVENGVLSVEDTAEPGNITVTCAGTKNTEKIASIDVEIGDFQVIKDFAIDGPKGYNSIAGTKGQYKVTKAVDKYDDNVIDLLPTVEWTSSNTEVATIDAATGELTVVAPGKTTVTVTVTNGTAVTTKSIENIVVQTYYITETATGDSTVIDVSNLIEADKYLITTAKDGKAVKQYESGAAVTLTAAEAGKKITAVYENGILKSLSEPEDFAAGDVIENSSEENTVVYYWKSLESLQPVKIVEEKTASFNVDTTGADKVEIAPIFEVVMNKEVVVPSDRYNVTVTANNGARTDVFVNDQMVFNNINQGSDNWTIARNIAAATDYTANDVVIGEGYANFNYRDDKSGASTITKVKFVKSPSIVNRKTRVYVIGDSLTAKYYGTPAEGKEELVRTGWGDVIGDYLTDDVEVTNLGNSGAWAEGMLGDAFTNVKLSGQEGDILLLESGYNDSSHTTMEVMRESVKAMVKGAEENGMTVFVITPNASTHSANEYLGNVKSTYDMIVAYNELVEDGSEAVLVNLADKSGQFFRSYYGDANYEDENGAIITAVDKFTIPKYTQLNPVYNNENDTLHSSYNAANCWAAIVANGILGNEGTASLVDKTHVYSFNDGAAEISVSAENIANADYVDYEVTYDVADVTVKRPNDQAFTKAGAGEMLKVVPADDTKTVKVVDSSGSVIATKTTTKNDKVTGYYFKMPAGAVTITVE